MRVISTFGANTMTERGGDNMRISDEKYLSALVACGSVRAAAQVLGVNSRKVAEKLENEDFRKRYDEARAAVLSETVAAMSATFTEAVRTLQEIASDTETAQSVRVSACDALLRHGLRYLEKLDFEKRLAALEEIIKGGAQ